MFCLAVSSWLPHLKSDHPPSRGCTDVGLREHRPASFKERRGAPRISNSSCRRQDTSSRALLRAVSCSFVVLMLRPYVVVVLSPQERPTPPSDLLRAASAWRIIRAIYVTPDAEPSAEVQIWICRREEGTTICGVVARDSPSCKFRCKILTPPGRSGAKETTYQACHLT